jgi:hypothetical protein
VVGCVRVDLDRPAGQKPVCGLLKWALALQVERLINRLDITFQGSQLQLEGLLPVPRLRVGRIVHQVDLLGLYLTATSVLG